MNLVVNMSNRCSGTGTRDDSRCAECTRCDPLRKPDAETVIPLFSPAREAAFECDPPGVPPTFPRFPIRTVTVVKVRPRFDPNRPLPVPGPLLPVLERCGPCGPSRYWFREPDQSALSLRGPHSGLEISRCRLPSHLGSAILERAVIADSWCDYFLRPEALPIRPVRRPPIMCPPMRKAGSPFPEGLPASMPERI